MDVVLGSLPIIFTLFALIATGIFAGLLAGLLGVGGGRVIVPVYQHLICYFEQEKQPLQTHYPKV